MSKPNTEREIVRPEGTRKNEAFSYCRWASFEWDAKFYAWTPTHRQECEHLIDQLVNNPAWFKCRPRKIDKKAATRNDNKNKNKKTQDWVT